MTHNPTLEVFLPSPDDIIGECFSQEGKEICTCSQALSSLLLLTYSRLDNWYYKPKSEDGILVTLDCIYDLYL